MKLPTPFRISASQAILFAPVAVLVILGLLAARNGCSRPIVHAEESPEGSREAFIILEYPPIYPFSGDVRAVLEVQRLPGHEPVAVRPLGSHRWAGTAISEYKTIDWMGEGLVTLRSADGDRQLTVRLDEGDSDR
jgi:hypothetical protein